MTLSNKTTNQYEVELRRGANKIRLRSQGMERSEGGGYCYQIGIYLRKKGVVCTAQPTRVCPRLLAM